MMLPVAGQFLYRVSPPAEEGKAAPLPLDLRREMQALGSPLLPPPPGHLARWRSLASPTAASSSPSPV
eukprot:CAMPEP_0114538458 /NCGR_PEP_ID=MMETSP0109-20121206/30154_1 /TAXON_ID=29199 /ORGANISM="Chlorarachnion reptans, Strain CCCM449" /LENGTH=67 /DNA_ID=CAMNT_0001722479 /DNA_START=143 /DNA_END=343 /DNA_ORIENTATION=+